VKRSTRTLVAIVAAFFAGVFVDSWLRVYGPPRPAVQPGGPTIGPAPDEVASSADGHAPATKLPPPLVPITPAPSTPVATTGRSALRVPIDGIDPDSMKGGFAEARAGHPHEAVDILAPRNTPVHAVQDGTIAKLFVSRAGGITIYQFDPTGRLCYYYAHLQRYADGLREGDAVKQGQVIGFVGTSGNAPAGTPHLHFAIFELGPDRRWWNGTAIDPYLVFKRSG